MAIYDFTMNVLTEVTHHVSVEAENEDDAKAKAKAGDFVSNEIHETTGVRSYEILSLDNVEDFPEDQQNKE